MSSSTSVIVIGGGAAGLMAAVISAREGHRVTILEKNTNLGVKLGITGGGRCNITNNERDLRKLLSHYRGATDFLFSPFSRFGVADTYEFFEGLGMKLEVEANNRVFPESRKALDVVSLFIRELQRLGVIVVTNCAVQKIRSTGGVITEVLTNKGTFTADHYILATGGMAHPETGSTGDGFKFLRELGHTVHVPTPTVVPLITTESWVHDLSGVTLSDVGITWYLDGIKQFTHSGNVLCTHFGISGPTILNISGTIASYLSEGEVTALISLFPRIDAGALDNYLVSIFDVNKNKMIKNLGGLVLPGGLSKLFLYLLEGIDPNTKAHSLTKTDRKLIVSRLQSLPITVTGTLGMNHAVIVDGGVSLQEIETKTMRSKVISNLSLVGDILHINRPSGGYSLQLCWTTGFVAGSCV